MNEIYDTGEITEDYSRFIFLALPKSQVQMKVIRI